MMAPARVGDSFATMVAWIAMVVVVEIDTPIGFGIGKPPCHPQRHATIGATCTGVQHRRRQLLPMPSQCGRRSLFTKCRLRC